MHRGTASWQGVESLCEAGDDAITEMLHGWQAGDHEVADRLMRLVYDELHQIARRLIPGEGRDPTLGPTAIVHELYLKLEARGDVYWKNRGHFFALATRMMRQLRVDHYRTKSRLKRGGDRRDVPLEEGEAPLRGRPESLLELDQALSELGRLSPRQAAVVELRYFGGLTIEETAGCLGIAPKTVVREWRRARAWLYRELTTRESR